MRPQIKISLNDLKKMPCDKYLRVILDRYGRNGLFDPLELIGEIGGNNYGDITWLIVNCKIAQTDEMIEYYNSL